MALQLFSGNANLIFSKEGGSMYHYIGSMSDYKDKLYQAEHAFDKRDWRTALGYFEACLQYAEKNGMQTSYLSMKVRDCKDKLGL